MEQFGSGGTRPLMTKHFVDNDECFRQYSKAVTFGKHSPTTTEGNAMNSSMLAAVVLLAGSVSFAAAQESYPAPGTLVDIGGRRLHLYCTGVGSPTVILESGAS